ncbi:DUF3891 family protein [Sporosarcina koreensis]|uniref:DUF3891 family protein n=1 Tax=Sporosarcina koreensis TaxID=334735 RepID=UPI00059077A9|nr:DUF3891 family protein [Sporosarcina koreensis]
MIVRERKDSFILVEQDCHGRLAEQIMSHWKEELFPGEEDRSSVLTAVRLHDVGWSPFDKEPFWNDSKQAPYRFTDFPLPSKIVLYRQGIDAVETVDAYSAMLCSEHYSHFVSGGDGGQSDDFLEYERKRRARLKSAFADFDETVFRQHYGILQLGDNFSLYCCVNESGAAKDQEHPFFVNGIPAPESLPGLPDHRLAIQFLDNRTIAVESFPFDAPFEVSYPYKEVRKEDIRKLGFQKAYDQADQHHTELRFVPQT